MSTFRISPLFQNRSTFQNMRGTLYVTVRTSLKMNFHFAFETVRSLRWVAACCQARLPVHRTYKRQSAFKNIELFVFLGTGQKVNPIFFTVTVLITINTRNRILSLLTVPASKLGVTQSRQVW